MTGRGRFADATFGRKQLMVLIALVATGAGIAIGLSARKAIWEGWVTDRLFQMNDGRSQAWIGLDPRPCWLLDLIQCCTGF